MCTLCILVATGNVRVICYGQSAVSMNEETGLHSWRRGVYMLGLG